MQLNNAFLSDSLSNLPSFHKLSFIIIIERKRNKKKIGHREVIGKKNYTQESQKKLNDLNSFELRKQRQYFF